jgi:hypothetical protein
VAAIVALAAVIAGHIFSGTTAGVALVAAGSIVGLWILAFSLVDLMKEFPPVQRQSVTAMASPPPRWPSRWRTRLESL